MDQRIDAMGLADYFARAQVLPHRRCQWPRCRHTDRCGLQSVRSIRLHTTRFPALGHDLQVDQNSRQREPYVMESSNQSSRW